MARRILRFIPGQSPLESVCILFILGMLVGSILLLLAPQIGSLFADS